ASPVLLRSPWRAHHNPPLAVSRSADATTAAVFPSGAGIPPLDTRHEETHSGPPPSHRATQPSHSLAESVLAALTPHPGPQPAPPLPPPGRRRRRRRPPPPPHCPPPAFVGSQDSSARLAA